MKINNRFKLVLILSLSIFLTVSLFAQEAGKLFEKALFLEESEGNLEKAIVLYEKIVKDFVKETGIAAKAQFHIGLCYEKLGKEEAIKAYDFVISHFPNEIGIVAEARERLTLLREEEPKVLTRNRLLPSESYLECQSLSSDGKKVVGIDFSKGQNLVVYDLATKKTKFLTDYNWDSKSGWTYIPIWSPDNKEVAFQGGILGGEELELWISNLDGESRCILRNTYGGLAPCKWLPDKSAILVVMANEDGSSSLGLVNVKDGKFTEICPMQRTYKGRGDVSEAAAGASVDVSPDGSLIAFSDGPPDGNRDIYIISIDGKDKIKMIDNQADDKDPRWSPDGSHMSFLSTRHGNWALWSVAIKDKKTDGPPVMILEGENECELGAWTEKGIILRSMVTMIDTYILDIDPQSYNVIGKPRTLPVLLSTPEIDMSPYWSPDGDLLSLFSYSRKDGSNEKFQTLLSADGKELKKFKFDPPFRSIGGTSRWLSDGSGFGTVYWDANKQLYLSCLELKTEEWKTKTIPTGDFSFPRPFTFTWSGDGKYFYYLRVGDDEPEPGIVEHNVETSEEKYFLHAKQGDSFGWSLKLSHDNKQLAFNWNDRIVVLDIETGQVNKFEYNEKQELYFPSWSPDNKYLLVKGYPDAGGDFNELFLFSILDGTIINLNISRYLPKDSRIITSPDWSSDGTKIAFDLGMWKSNAELISNVIPEK